MKIGDVVRLKSGGPKLTVQSDVEVGTVACAWFDNGDIKTTRLKVDSLKIIEEEE